MAQNEVVFLKRCDRWWCRRVLYDERVSGMDGLNGGSLGFVENLHHQSQDQESGLSRLESWKGESDWMSFLGECIEQIRPPVACLLRQCCLHSLQPDIVLSDRLFRNVEHRPPTPSHAGAAHTGDVELLCLDL